MGRTLTVFVMMLPTIAIGFGVPVASMHYLDPLAASAISGLALLFACGLGFFTIVEGVKHIPPEIDKGEREQLRLLQAHQRATLEEFDDILMILKEIRDVLKSAEGER